MPIPTISEEPPTLTGVRMVVFKLRSSNVVAICSIPTELLKTDDELMAQGLHVVMASIWLSATIPPVLLRGVVIPFWKGKGGRWNYSNDQDITPLSIQSKVLVHILLSHIRNYLLKH